MAGESNVIQVLIESVDKMSQDLRRIQVEMGKVDTATGGTSRAMGAAAASSRGLFAQMGPLRSVLVQLTGVTGSFGTAMFNLVRFGFTPQGVAIAGVIAVATGLISKWVGAKEEAEKLDKSLREQRNAIAVLNLEYGVLTKSISEADAAVRKFWLSQEQQLTDLADRVGNIRWWRERILGAGTTVGEFILGAFGRSQADVRKLEDELASRLKLSQEQAGAIGRNVTVGEIEKSTQVQLDFIAQIDQTQIELMKLTNGEEAAARAMLDYAEEVARAKIAHDSLDPSIAVVVRQLKEEKLALLEAQEAQKRKNEENEREVRLGELRSRVAKGVRETIENEIDLDRQLGSLEADRLETLGRMTEAERKRLENEIDNLRRRRKLIEDNLGNVKVIDAQIANAETKLNRLGRISLDVGGHVARTLEDIFTAMITGTLKSVDIGRTIMATLGRMVTDVFRQILQQKLAFEATLFNNLRSLPGQASGALAAGGTSVGGAAGGGGGLGGLFGSLGSTIGGLILPGLGGFGIGSLIGGTPGGIGGALGGIGGALLNTLAIPSFLGGIGGTFGGTLGAALGGAAFGGIGATLGNLILPGVGAVLGGIFGGLFGKKDRRAGSKQRRAAAASAGLQSTQAGGFQLTQEEANIIAQFMQNATGLSQFGVAEQGNVRTGMQNVPIGVLVGILEGLRAKGGRALGGAPSFEAELRRRGLPTGAPREIFTVLEKQLGVLRQEAEQIERMAQTLALNLSSIADQTAELKLQAQLLGKSAAEALKLRREFDLARLAAAGLTGEQLKQVDAALQIRDAAALELDQKEKALELADQLRASVTRGLAGVDPAAVFGAFMSDLSQAIADAAREGMVRAFVEQRLMPLIRGPLGNIMDIFGTVGRGRTVEEAFAAASPQISMLKGEFAAMEPVLRAMGELMRDFLGKIRSSLGVPSLAGPTNVVININGNVNDRDDVLDLARRISAYLAGQTGPPF